MAYGLWQRIYRERRRLAFVTTLAFLAGAIFYLRVDHQVMGVHVSLITGAIYAGIIAPTALFFCLVLPSIRFFIEAVAISRLTLSVFVFGAPEIGYQILSSPMLTAALIVLGAAAISRVLHGKIHKARIHGWREKLHRWRQFSRTPARIRATEWQQRYVGWIDDAVPVPA